MMSQAEISLRFYKALDATEKCLVEIAKKHPWKKHDCDNHLRRMEEVADEVLRIAVRYGWVPAHEFFLEYHRSFEAFAQPYR